MGTTGDSGHRRCLKGSVRGLSAGILFKRIIIVISPPILNRCSPKRRSGRIKGGRSVLGSRFSGRSISVSAAICGRQRTAFHDYSRSVSDGRCRAFSGSTLFCRDCLAASLKPYGFTAIGRASTGPSSAVSRGRGETAAFRRSTTRLSGRRLGLTEQVRAPAACRFTASSAAITTSTASRSRGVW